MLKGKMDKRVQKTQQSLRSALLDLMIECGYERLSVQQILDRAGVGRATFYLHYRSKEDLLRKSLDQLREHLIQEWQTTLKGKAQSKAPLGFSLAFFRHVDSHRRLYQAVVGRESGVIVDRQMRRLLTELVKESVSLGQRERNRILGEMAAQYVAGALMSIVTWWLDRNVNLSPEEIDSAFLQMTIPALRSIGHL